MTNAEAKHPGTADKVKRHEWWNKECNEAVLKNVARQKWVESGVQEERKKYVTRNEKLRKLDKNSREKLIENKMEKIEEGRNRNSKKCY